jgi:CPA2 family monovalent cation:H+ antiporter-2
MSVGMGLNLAAAVAEIGWFLASIVGLFALKSVVIASLALLFGLGWRTALEMGLLLGQAGEFAFIVVAQATVAGLVVADTGQFMQLVAGATMLATPLVAPLAERIGQWLEHHAPDLRWTAKQAGELTDHVIVAGYGRVGRMLGELLDRQLVPYVALDLDADIVRAASGAGAPVHYGNASRADILGRVSADRALAVVVTTDDPRAVERVVATVREHWPELPVFARARDVHHAGHLLQLGATQVVAEAIEASLQLGEVMLRGIGIPPDAARDLVDEHRKQALMDIETVRLSSSASDNKAASPAKRRRGDASRPRRIGERPDPQRK